MKPVDVNLAITYTDSETGETVKPNADMTINWRGMPYCAMVQVERALLEMLLKMNDGAQEVCKDDTNAQALREKLSG